MRPQVGGIAVEPAEVALVDRLEVVVERAVVAAAVPLALEARRQLQPLGDLGGDVALVEQPQRLVVDVAVEVALLGEEVDDPVGPPAGPVMLGEHHVAAGGEHADRLVEVGRPAVRIADQGAAQREDVVQVVGGVLGHAQRAPLGEQEVHLGRRLGVGRELEHHVDAVDRLLLAGAGDVDRRRDQRHGAGRRRLAQPGADLPGGALGQQRAVHVRGAAGHRSARVDVLADRVLEEPVGGEHGHAAGRHVVGRDDAACAAEVVDVAVRVQQPGDRPLAAMLAVERQRRRRALGRDQRVDHEHAGVALDDRHVRQVEPAHLVDARRRPRTGHGSPRAGSAATGSGSPSPGTRRRGTRTRRRPTRRVRPSRGSPDPTGSRSIRAAPRRSPRRPRTATAAAQPGSPR